MTKKPCFSRLYDCRTRECQCCSVAVDCFLQMKGNVHDRQLSDGKIVAVMQILNKHRYCTASFLGKELKVRFGRGVNIFHYLRILKERGLLDVTVESRKRLYSLR